MSLIDDLSSAFTSGIGSLSELLGPEGDHTSILDNLSSGWNQLSDFASSGLSKIDELNNGLNERMAEIADLKSKNYDLLMAQPGADNRAAADKEPGSEGAADPEGISFSDLISDDLEEPQDDKEND